MAASVIGVPKFCRGQRVCFAGGEGTVQTCKFEAGNWAYHLKMAMGLEPDFGRAGCETTIVLAEFELEVVEKSQFKYLAIVWLRLVLLKQMLSSFGSIVSSANYRNSLVNSAACPQASNQWEEAFCLNCKNA